jgi:signal transduction histidine kinase
MENIKFSFLSFLWVLSAFLSVLPLQQISAQEPIDSTSRYYYKIANPKSPEDLPRGYGYFKKQKEERLAKKDTVGAIYALRMLAMAEFEMGRTYASEKSAIEAIALLDASSNKNRKEANADIGIYNHLGMVYRSIDQPQKAIDAYARALFLASQLKDSIVLLNNMANSYNELKQKDKAIAILKLAYEKSSGQENKIEIARTLDNLGHLQSKAGHPEGLPHMLQALTIRKKTKDNGQLFTSYKHLSEHYRNAGDSVLALRYATLGKETAAKVSTAYKKEALSNYLKLSNNPDIAQYMSISDSIAKATLQQDNKFSSIEYNFSKEKEHTQAAKLAQEKQRQLKSIYQLVGICILLLAIALYLILKYRHKKEKVQQLYNTESKISKRVHDEVANDIYKIMVKIQTSPDTAENLLDDLETVYNKTRDISKKHSPIDLDADFESVLIDLLKYYQSDSVNVITKNLATIDWSLLDDLKKKTIYRVLQELMTNMHKHSRATLVVITATQSGKKLKLRYTDNGVGSVLKKGNGLLNTENRIRLVNGTIIFEVDKNEGFTVKISL